MAIKKFEMQRKRSDGGFDVHYPKTSTDMVIDESLIQDKLAQEKKGGVQWQS